MSTKNCKIKDQLHTCASPGCGRLARHYENNEMSPWKYPRCCECSWSCPKKNLHEHYAALAKQNVAERQQAV